MRDSFIFYRSFFEASKHLTTDQAADLYFAICSYALDQKELELDDVCQAMFSLIKPQLDANYKKYLNGKKKAKSSKKIAKKSKQLANANENVNVNANDNDNIYREFAHLKISVKDYEKLYLHFKDTTLVGSPTDPTHIDDIYFVSLNDPYVMEAWWKKMKIKNCKYLADGSGAFTLRLDQQGGMTPGQTVVEMYNKGYGKRSWRYVLLMENNCQMCYVEEETPENVSTRDNLEGDL